MIVRHDVDVESIGTMAALPEDMSPLQIGAEGDYQGQRFGIIGRMKIGWEDGVWNEWFILTDTGREGWLAEAQGFYAVCFASDYNLPANFYRMIRAYLGETEQIQKAEPYPYGTEIIINLRRPDSGQLKLGSYLMLGNKKFRIVDIKQASCRGSEGELPFPAPVGKQFISVDLLGGVGEFASVELEDGKLRLHTGHYLEWDELRCINTRPLEHW